MWRVFHLGFALGLETMHNQKTNNCTPKLAKVGYSATVVFTIQREWKVRLFNTSSYWAKYSW